MLGDRRVVFVTVLAALAVAVITATANAQRTIRRFTGDAPGDGFGAAVAGVGDTNGDGKIDVLIGAPNAGYARVLTGATGATLHTFRSKRAGDRFGRSVASAGDVNRDGHADLLVASATRIQALAGRYWTEIRSYPRGSSFANAGDVNRDGHADLVIGDEHGGPKGGGSVVVHSGRDGRILWSATATTRDCLGASVAGVGDTDGDGFADVLAGAPCEGPGATTGYAILYSGRTGAPLARIAGVRGSLLGHAVSAAGDIDRDGHADFVIGVPMGALYMTPSSVVVYSGRTRRVLWQLTSRRTERFGFRLALGGDVDADGLPELLIEARDTATSALRILSTRTRKDVMVLREGYGTSFGPAGDVNGDGVGDLVLGAPGWARIVSGRDLRVRFEQHGALCAPHGTIRGVRGLADLDGDRRNEFLVTYSGIPPRQAVPQEAIVYSGATRTPMLTLALWTPMLQEIAASGAGRVDSDARPDVIVAWYSLHAPTPFSRVEVFSGVSGQRIHSFRARDGQYGFDVDGRADWNRDGHADLVIGTPRRGETGGGFVEIRSGRTGDVLRTLHGNGPGDRFGHALRVIGDTDGDGSAELAVGAPDDDDRGVDSGSVRVFSTRTGAILRTLTGDAVGDHFGRAVAAAGDLDGDGRADLAVGAPGAASGGLVRVFSGRDWSVLGNIAGRPGDRLGTAVAGGLDADGDRIPDIVVGAPGNDQNAPGAGAIHLVSGRMLKIIETFHGDHTGDGFGTFAGITGDFSGDRRAELLGGTPKGGFGDLCTLTSDGGYVRAIQLGQPGVTSAFGIPCPGSRGPLSLSTAGAAAPGGSIDVSLFPLRPRAVTTLFFGTSNRRAGQFRLPLSLARFGLTGCVLYTSQDAVLQLRADPMGRARHRLVIPASNALVDRAVYVQSAAPDPGFNAAGIVTSNAGLIFIGH